MKRSEIPPNLISEALSLREAGFTTLAISQRIGISVRTLNRHFGANKTKKGAIKEALLNQAKADLLARVTCDQTIKEEAARMIADDLAHTIHLREIMLNASQHMIANNLTDSVRVMRAAAAYSTAIKNTSDIMRHGLRLERLNTQVFDELPELVITELTADEVKELRDADTINNIQADQIDESIDEDIVVGVPD